MATALRRCRAFSGQLARHGHPPARGWRLLVLAVVLRRLSPLNDGISCDRERDNITG